MTEPRNAVTSDPTDGWIVVDRKGVIWGPYRTETEAVYIRDTIGGEVKPPSWSHQFDGTSEETR